MFKHQILNASTDFFNELFFGQGAWLGVILVLALLFLVSVKIRFFGIIGAVVSVFLGIQYFTTVSASSNLNWCGILCFVSIPFFLIMSLGRKDIL